MSKSLLSPASPSPGFDDAATIVVFSDVHLDRRFAWCRPEAARRRRNNIRRSFTKIVELAEELNADAVVCAGDLYEDELFTPDCANFTADLLAMNRPVLLAPGNHDYFSTASMYARQSWPSNVTVFSEDRFVPVELAPGLRVWGAAHRTPQGTRGFFDEFPGVDGGGVNLALFHGSEVSTLRFEDATKSLHAPFSDADVARSGFDYAFVGHYHRHRIATHHCYPGNPDPLDFGEDDRGGVAIARVHSSGEVEITAESVAITTCSDVVVDVSDATSVSAMADMVHSDVAAYSGYLRVDLVGDVSPDVTTSHEEIVAALDPVLENSFDDWLVRSDQLRPRYDYQQIAQELSVRGAFVQEVLDDDGYDEITRRQILEIGLRAFEGRSDLAVV